MEHMINLVVGDWSHDGHSMTQTIVIRSNLTAQEIEDACMAGAKKLGVAIDRIADSYEDDTISDDDLKKLTDAGLETTHFYKDGAKTTISVEDFVDIYLFLVKQGNPKFEHEPAESEVSNVYVGGYGLFT